MVTSVRFLHLVSNHNNLERYYDSTEEKSVLIAFSFPVPTAPPGKVIVTAASSTSLFVIWRRVPQKHRHGEVLGYKIYIRLANKQNDPITVPVFNSTQSYVDDLQVYTLYGIRVSAVNDIGEGPKSETFSARTMASGKLISLVRAWRSTMLGAGSLIYLQHIFLIFLYSFIEDYAPVFRRLKSILDIVFVVLLNHLRVELRLNFFQYTNYCFC